GDGEISFSAAHGEKLHPDGSVFHDSRHITGHFQVDHVRLDADHRTFQPRFSYKGFRYVEVRVANSTDRPASGRSASSRSANDGPPDLELTALRISNDLPRHTRFS